MSLLVAALDYWRRGWSVIPIRNKPGTKGKQPAVAWTKFQLEPADEQQVREWFGGSMSVTGVAIIFGDVSGGLTCRDFDTREAYEAWKAAFPELAAKLPTAQTSRGCHVYFRSKHRGIQKFSDGELKGAGYCLAPPSIHPDGSTYRWIVPLSAGALPFIDPFESGLAALATERTEKAERTENTENTETQSNTNCSGLSVLSVGGTARFSEEIERAINATLPSKIGQRNIKVFEFARFLKAIPALASAPVQDLWDYVREWHRRALPFIGTQPFDETWAEFVYGWDRVKFPAGANPLIDAKEQALRLPDEYGDQFDCPKTLLLIKICKVLQQNAGDGPFFLSTRVAGGLLELDHTVASKRLQMLERAGLLRVESRGSEHRATRFRYLGK